MDVACKNNKEVTAEEMEMIAQFIEVQQGFGIEEEDQGKGDQLDLCSTVAVKRGYSPNSVMAGWCQGDLFFLFDCNPDEPYIILKESKTGEFRLLKP